MPPSMIPRAVARLIEASRRHALAVAVTVLSIAALAGLYTARHASIDTDEEKLISPDLAWRRTAAELDAEFPQNRDLLAVVVDAPTPDQADDAAQALAQRLRAMPHLLRDVRRPDALPFFRSNGLLFMTRAEVQKFADDMISAQPLLGTLAADPNLRGVLGALDLMAQGVIRGEIGPAAVDGPIRSVSAATEAALKGRRQPLSWQTLLSGRKAGPRELRRFVLAQPTLDFNAVEPGHQAVLAIRSAAREAGLGGEAGVRVRVTGPVALNDDQLSTLSEGAGVASALSIGLLCFWLVLGLRSLRTVAAVLLTLMVGLVACGTLAVLAVGPFNPISVAFAPLFIGIAIDFGIQFSVRHAAESALGGDSVQVFERTALGVGGALVVAAAATAAGFLAFVPTDYTGVSDLGKIAGAGMLIALVLNLTLLPALLELLGAKAVAGQRATVRLAAVDGFLVRRRGWVGLASLAVAALSVAILPHLRFDFNPINLQDQHSESVSTLFDLMKDPQTTPNTIDVLVPSAAEADALAKRLSSLPEVDQVVYARSFVPADQEAKLDILRDAGSLLEPTLNPPERMPAPSDAEVMAAVSRCAADMAKLGAKGDNAALGLARALEGVMAAGRGVLPALAANLSDGAERRLDDLRQVLKAGPVDLGTLPREVTADWIGADGRWHLQVYPKGDSNDNEVLRRFCSAVQAVAPAATGTPVTIQESARTVTHAFAYAGVVALCAIVVLLLIVLRRLWDVALVLAPLLLAGMLTLATGVVVGLPLNFANIITLPLLLGIGVAFDIYFVMRWRAGEGSPLSSSTARAVLFSALTTGTAFGSLAFSRSPGMADMGKLLSLALLYTLLCTFLVLPALLGEPPSKRDQ